MYVQKTWGVQPRYMNHIIVGEGACVEDILWQPRGSGPRR